MSRLLFADVETSGLPDKSRANRDPVMPRIVTVAWAIADSYAGVEELRHFVVRPDGFVISREASAVHGISQEMALRVGLPIASVLDQLTSSIQKFLPSQLVAHNLQFDREVIVGEYRRSHRIPPFSGMSEFCTMLKTTDACAIPGKRGRFKWPKLEELYRHLFNRELRDAHNAVADVCATVECYHQLSRTNLVQGGIPLHRTGNLERLRNGFN